MRGRTVGEFVAPAEQGAALLPQPPEHAAVGTAMMNDVNVRWAAEALGWQVLEETEKSGIAVPSVVIAHDTRHFSRHFSLIAAQALLELGVDVMLFHEPRSTPALSFTVRHCNAQGGMMITASHNPPHDNGLKAYGPDGAQLVEPRASALLTKVQALREGERPRALRRRGILHGLGAEMDQAYQRGVSELVLDPMIFSAATEKLKVIYTPLHGTGIAAIPALFKAHGVTFSVVSEQAVPDGNFSTVTSPNPENTGAFTLALAQAKREKADLVLATDPDGDRLGAAVRTGEEAFEFLTGNQIGAILAQYRLQRLFELGVLNGSNCNRACIIKTFVTTDLQKKIAEHFGVRCIETLTGFKYIAEKLQNYQIQCALSDYAHQPLTVRRAAQLERGTWMVCGGEESYGFSGGDTVRDKDANAAALMLAEIASWALQQGWTLVDYLNHIYVRFGYFSEKLGTLTLEGASGADSIAWLMRSYAENPPAQMRRQAVARVENFDKSEIHDVDGKRLPRENMLLFQLADGSKMVVRGSGTEPKIKFYFFIYLAVDSSATLLRAKQEAGAMLDQWWVEMQADAKRRLSEKPALESHSV